VPAAAPGPVGSGVYSASPPKSLGMVRNSFCVHDRIGEQSFFLGW
jgi:hypothetical protein